jgi:hypothetical protein
MEMALQDIIGKMISTMKFAVTARLTVLVLKISSTSVRDNMSMIPKRIWKEESTEKSEKQ